MYYNDSNRGYAYGNPYRLNFSRNYPRVVVYSQNFAVEDEVEYQKRCEDAELCGMMPPDRGQEMREIRAKRRERNSTFPSKMSAVEEYQAQRSSRAALSKRLPRLYTPDGRKRR